MERRGTVWIAPDGYVPAGRMIDPEATDFWVSWQDDDRALEDDAVRGADAAIEWGRKRSRVVMIRLGHSAGTYFSAGDERPAVERDDPNWPVPAWPPEGPPTGGWWSPPPARTLDQVAAKSELAQRDELDRQAAREWAEELLLTYRDLGAEVARALWALRGTDEPLTG
jgi:hypothetical protein